jgi:DNA-binding SARP family transcriptional activator
MRGRVRFRLFGGFSAMLDDPEPRPIRVASRHYRALLACWIRQPDHTETRERLATLLWGESTDQQARHNLRQSLSTLRKDLAEAGCDLLKGDRDTVTLDGALVAADALEFRSLVKAGGTHDLETACALYTGEFLDGLNIDAATFETWQQRVRSEFRGELALALEPCIRRHDESGKGEAAIGYATRLANLSPENETAQVDRFDRPSSRTDRRTGSCKHPREVHSTRVWLRAGAGDTGPRRSYRGALEHAATDFELSAVH